jgi:hypothetical protein
MRTWIIILFLTLVIIVILLMCNTKTLIKSTATIPVHGFTSFKQATMTEDIYTPETTSHLIPKKYKFKVSVLIICSDIKERFKYEKAIWLKNIPKDYRLSVTFLYCDDNSNEDYLLNTGTAKQVNNFVTGACKESYRPGIYIKTLRALSWLQGKYDYYVRTNLSTFIRFNSLFDILSNFPTNVRAATGGWMGWGFSGTSIVMNSLACDYLLDQDIGSQNWLKMPDDVAISKILMKDCKILKNTDILYWWSEKLSYHKNMTLIKNQNAAFIRTLPHGNEQEHYKLLEYLSTLNTQTFLESMQIAYVNLVT